MLSVYPTTLRRWADSGSIPYFRTPGRHRRFRTADLVARMEDKQTVAKTTCRHLLHAGEQA